MVELRAFETDYKSELAEMIIGFYAAHNVKIGAAEAEEKIAEWTARGHLLYVIGYGDNAAGFLHLGERGGGAADWLEDIYVKPEFRRQGIARRAIAAAEQIVRANGSSSMYIEVVPSAAGAIGLYYGAGFDTLNTITLCKDFEEKEAAGKQTLGAFSFKITKPN